MKVRIDRVLFLFLILILVFSLCYVVAAEEDEWVDVIVRLKENKDKPLPKLEMGQFKDLSNEDRKLRTREVIEKRAEKIRKNQDEFLAKTNTKIEQVSFKYKTVNAVAMRIKRSELEALKNDPDVEHVEEDFELKAAVQTSVPLIEADTVHSMNIGGTSIDGSGFSVCVVDSGVYYTHPALGSCTQAQFLAGNCAKVPFGYDFYNNDNDPIDDYYHGTHVAGISSLSSPAGVAPGSKIIAMKVLSSSGSGSGSQVLAGIDACIANATLYNITAITLSLGNNQVYNNASICDNSTIAFAIDNAVAAGILVAVASGNNAGTTGVSYPACVSNATSVGSTKDVGWGTVDTVSSFTNRGALLDLMAPGERINSTALPSINNGWWEGSGTSQATPHVSGAAALLQQYSQLINGMQLTPYEVRSILKKTGKPIYDSSTGLTFPRINLTGAINSVLLISGKTIFNNLGKVSYPSATDITYAQHCINLSQNKLQIDPADSYCTNFNTNANITLNRVGFTKTPVILGDGQICPSSICSLINWNGENITFSVTHFSTYSVAATSSLVINDQGGSIYTYNNTYFYANYTNFTSSSINDNTDAGQCNISFNVTPSTVYQMTYNSSSGLYEYNKTFTYSQAGSVGWTVSCDSNYEPRTLTAATNVLSSGNFAPTVSITAPPNASVFEQRDQINFTGTGSDREDILTLTWYSSIDGYFGTGANVNKSDLSVGNHTIMLNTTDSGGLTANYTIIITINAIPDQDGDGLRDSQDAVVGNTSNISITGVSQINVYINGSSNIDGQIFSGKLPVLINDNGNALCNFTYNFSQSSLNFSRLSIKKDWYYTICLLGGQLQSGNGKTIFLTDNGFTGLCVKDAADINVSNISDACNATDEHDFTSCLGNSTGVAVNGFTCVDHGSTIEINNLTHSGVKGTGGSAPSSGSSSSTSSGTGSGGGGGGGGSAAALYGVPGNVEIDNPCWAEETTFTVYSKAGQLASMMDIQFAKPFTNELIVSGKTDKQGKFTYTFEEKGLYNMIVGRAMPLKLQIRIIDCTQPEPVKAAAKEAADNKTEVTEPQEYAVEDVIEQQAKEDEQKKPRRLPKNRIYILGTLFLIPGAIIGYFVYTTNKKKHKHKKKKNHMKNAFRNIYKL